MRSLSLPLRSAPALLGLLFATSVAHADLQADTLLRQVERATRALPSLGADLQVTLITQDLGARSGSANPSGRAASGISQAGEPVSFTYTGTVKLCRPNLVRIELADPINQTIACDGEALWTLLQTNEYIKNPADPQGKNPSAYAQVLMFFAPETIRTAGALLPSENSGADNFSTRYLGKERLVLKVVGNRQDPVNTAGSRDRTAEEFDVVEIRQLRPTPQAVKLYINADRIVVRVISEARRGNQASIQVVSLLNLKPGQVFNPSEFVFALPANARPFVPKSAPPRK